MAEGTEPITADMLKAASEIVYQHMLPTQQINWPLLCQRTGADVWVKHENQTPIGAFKVRGGLVYLDCLKREMPDVTGIITATRGNHGQSIACAAAKVGMKATIVVPEGNNPEKNNAMEAFGGALVVHGRDFQDSKEFAVARADRDGLHIIPPFHPALMLGVATYGLELFCAVEDLDTVYVPIGQGSGACGVITARDILGLKTKIVGVVAEAAPSYALSFEAGKVVETKTANTLADGMACRVPDPAALDIILKGLDRVLRVSDEEILMAMGHYFTDTHNLAEGAGAAPLAALMKEKDRMKGRKVGLILSGGNVDRDLYGRVLSII